MEFVAGGSALSSATLNIFMKASIGAMVPLGDTVWEVEKTAFFSGPATKFPDFFFRASKSGLFS